MDLYLYEGIKTIYRMGISFLVLSARTCNPASFSTGQEYWDQLRANRTDPTKCPSFYEICSFAHDAKKFFFQTKCVPPRATIAKIEEEAKSILMERLGSEFRAKLPKTDLTETAIEISDSTDRISISLPESLELHEKSTILDQKMSKLLESYLPQTMHLEGFELIFGTHTDGWGLQQMYHRCVRLSPCILLIQTEDGAVFGAYLSTEITPPHPNPKGDGRCFVFRLNGPEAKQYLWCSSNEEGNTFASHHQYFVSSAEYLSVGSDMQHATNAIRLSSDLHTVVCVTSDTYRNKRLAGTSASFDLKVVEVEVLCGRVSVLKSGSSPHMTPIKQK